MSRGCTWSLYRSLYWYSRAAGVCIKTLCCKEQPSYSLNRLGLYEALCGSAQGFIQDVVFRVLSFRTKYNTKMTARARSLYTVPTGWDCMNGARALRLYSANRLGLYEGHTRARPLYSANRLGLYEGRARAPFIQCQPVGTV